MAYLSIGLMAVTIPTYAISVTFLRRESKRTLMVIERRREDLKEKTETLSKKIVNGSAVEALKDEIKKYEKDMEGLKKSLRSLSMTGAFLAPFSLFGLGLIMSIVAWATFQNLFTAAYSFLAGLAIVSGAILLTNTLFAVEKAALGPESLAELRISFKSGSTVEKFKAEEPPVLFILHNYGEEAAEMVKIVTFFPSKLTPQKDPGFSPGYRIGITPDIGVYKHHTVASFEIPIFYPGEMVGLYVWLETPVAAGVHQIPVWIWERRLGKIKQQLTLEVTRQSKDQADHPTS